MPLEGALLLSFVLYSSVLIAACILVSEVLPDGPRMQLLLNSFSYSHCRHRTMQDMMKVCRYELKAHEKPD